MNVALMLTLPQVWRINPLQTAECVEKLERFMRLSAEARKARPCPGQAKPSQAMPCRIGYALLLPVGHCATVLGAAANSADVLTRAVRCLRFAAWSRHTLPQALFSPAAVGFVRRSSAG